MISAANAGETLECITGSKKLHTPSPNSSVGKGKFALDLRVLLYQDPAQLLTAAARGLEYNDDPLLEAMKPPHGMAAAATLSPRNYVFSKYCCLSLGITA